MSEHDMGVKTSVTSPIDRTKDLEKALKGLARADVLVGIPEDKTDRRETKELTNAAVAYINNYGAPEANIPARPFMEPGIRNAKKPIVKYLGQAGDAALSGDPAKEMKALNAAGLVAATSVKNKIREGPFAPLALRTIQARAARGRQGAKAHLASLKAGEAPAADLVQPLVDTGQMRNAITYIVRMKK